jgi:pimeloyl-ACP methyl ester carboxylesterase
MLRATLTLFGFAFVIFSLSAQKNPEPCANRGGDDQLIYPHVFVHDIGGGGDVWQSFMDYMEPAVQSSVTLGFCLNQDPLSTEMFDDVSGELLWPGLPPVSDLYRLTFNCDPEGLCDEEGMTSVMSNEAAILKQAVAIRKAVTKVLNATGKDKVVLIGHGVGGLAIREYHQNPDLWTGNTSRVAKLVTVGTPHMGSNYEPSAGIMSPGDSLSVNSEAMRDLRNSYDSAGVFLSQGAYLWGSSNETQEELYSDFNGPWINVDINCNGDTGDLIPFNALSGFEALNNRDLDLLIDYSSIHDPENEFANPENLQFSLGAENSDAWNSGGCDFCAFLEENGYDVTACESFTSSGADSFTGGHATLPEQSLDLLRAVDEPDCFQQAFEVDFYQNYAAFITNQGEGAMFWPDYDNFKVVLDEPTILTVNLSYVVTSTPIRCRIWDSNADESCTYTAIHAEDNNVVTGSTVSTYLTAGTHFIGFDCSFNFSFANPFEQYWFYLTKEPVLTGCLDPLSCSYDEDANWDDGSMCDYPFDPCDDGNDLTINDTYNAFCVCVGEDVSSNNELSRISVRAQPNPANQSVQFISTQKLSGIQAFVFDYQGRLVLQNRLDESGQLDVWSLPDGMYQVSLKLGHEEFEHLRLLVQH